ncbi:hypothetical protein [Shewanella aegiceratis]|uniref:hypothetical protein n=1 Tax=Shewanella aegiceratis TaxID=2864203 RepID=UPI001C661606|nr:hypothetical protein [Shewanella aegiceratis]QYJ81884.1 hypothetical protein K0H80_16535 [Shewanella aegiceratis]
MFAVFLTKKGQLTASFCLFIYLFYLNKYFYRLLGDELAKKCEKNLPFVHLVWDGTVEREGLAFLGRLLRGAPPFKEGEAIEGELRR